MTEQELKALKARLLEAHTYGYDVAKSDEIAEALVDHGASKPKSTFPTARELLVMVAEIEESRVEEAPAAPEPVLNDEQLVQEIAAASKFVAEAKVEESWDENPPQFAFGALDPADHPDEPKPESDE